MKNCLLLLLYFGLSSCQGVVGEDELLVKKGTFPFMAFIYYSDPSVVDLTGARFIRSAVLIRSDWLITSALGPSVIDNNGFPKKTLLARVGAVTIDSNFTLNEDEDEQEREVIQIVRPYNHSATQWWTTDISLMKTLVPFNLTAVVDVKTINIKRAFDEKTCIILAYAKKTTNRSDNKALMQLFVEVLPATMESCGSLFSKSTMTCAADSVENKNSAYDPNFCQGNSGGPLICEGEVMGLQTYIGNNCKQPHLYQLLSAWDNFITCGIEDKCMEEHCGNICDVTYKDPPKNEDNVTILEETYTLAETETTVKTTTSLPETKTPEGEIVPTPTVLVTEDDKEIVTTTSTTETTTTTTTTPSLGETTETSPWPKEKTDERRHLVDENEERKANVEAQQAMEYRSATEKNMCFVQTIIFGLVLCLF